MINTILLSISETGGWTIALVGYSIVFVALACLIIIFTQIPKLLKMKIRFSLKKKGEKTETTDIKNLDMEGNVSAAIGMALHMYFNEMHDEESNIMTINRIQRRYSPWSSKIYNIYNNTLTR